MDPKSLPEGGPAFPTDNEQQNGPSSYHYEGMSLRDYFAAKAMSSIDLQSFYIYGGEDRWLGAARECYELADAMLLARGEQA